MKIKKLIFIPAILIVISVISSVIAFRQSNLLNMGYLYVDGEYKEAVYNGEYVAVVGNTGDAYFISVLLDDTYIEITTYDIDNSLMDSYHVTVAKKGMSHDPSLVLSNIEGEIVSIDEMDEYLLILNLEENTIYDINLEVVDNDPYTDDIDLAFAHIPEHIYNLKTLMEGLAFSTLVFAVISSITIVAIIFIRKNR